MKPPSDFSAAIASPRNSIGQLRNFAIDDSTPIAPVHVPADR